MGKPYCKTRGFPQTVILDTGTDNQSTDQTARMDRLLCLLCININRFSLDETCVVSCLSLHSKNLIFVGVLSCIPLKIDNPQYFNEQDPFSFCTVSWPLSS